MAVVWNHGSDGSGGPFDRHAEEMKRFGRSHSSVRSSGTRRDGRPVPAGDALPGQVISLSGGEKISVSPTGWANLVSIWRVTLRRFSGS